MIRKGLSEGSRDEQTHSRQREDVSVSGKVGAGDLVSSQSKYRCLTESKTW